MIDTALLHSRIANRAEDYLRELFGDNFKRAGAGKWRVGSKGSLAVSIEDGALVYYSHEDGTGGDCVALWQRERGGTAGEALRAVAAWAGIADDGAPPAPAARRAAAKTAKPAPAPMSREQLAEASAMAVRLGGDSRLCERIAKARGWQAETVRGLALEPVLGWHEGKLAFLYNTGIKLRWQDNGERIIRFRCGNAGELWRGWRLHPGVSKVYVCEGETDAITLIDAGAESSGDCLVVALPSASSIPCDIVETLAGRDIVLCLDHDEAGQNASAKLEAILRGHVRSLSRWRATE